MSDVSSDEYHEDSLPDLVLSSSFPRDEFGRGQLREYCSEESLEYYVPPDVVGAEEQTNIEDEYFTSGDQITSTVGSDGVRVSYSDHSKPYLPKISCSDAYRSYLNLTIPSDDEETSLALEEQFHSLSLATREVQIEDWRQELDSTEAEIQSLRTDILSKVRKSNLLKKKLGITAWREFSTDIQDGWRKVQDSGVYQKFEGTFSDIGESIDEFKDVMKKDLEKAKEKASLELSTAKQKAAAELSQAKQKAATELHIAQKKTSQSLANVQKKASVILRAVDEREYRKEERIDSVS